MTIIDILLIVLIISASALCIALIMYLGKITSSLNKIQKDINTFSAELNPLLGSINSLAEKVSDFSEKANDQLEITRNIISSIRERVNTILELEERVRGGIEGPILSVTTNIKAISNGINTFLKSFRKNN